MLGPASARQGIACADYSPSSRRFFWRNARRQDKTIAFASAPKRDGMVFIGVAEATNNTSPVYTMLWRRIDPATGAFLPHSGAHHLRSAHRRRRLDPHPRHARRVRVRAPDARHLCARQRLRAHPRRARELFRARHHRWPRSPDLRSPRRRGHLSRHLAIDLERHHRRHPALAPRSARWPIGRPHRQPNHRRQSSCATPARAPCNASRIASTPFRNVRSADASLRTRPAARRHSPLRQRTADPA